MSKQANILEQDHARTRPFWPQIQLYYPAEGFGVLYRRVMTNDFCTDLIRSTNIQTVAEVPLDSYGIVGAGSLIFVQLGCRVTLISQSPELLDRARALMDFNGVSDVRYLHSSMDRIPVADNTFDFTWSFDRLQSLSNPTAFLQELCRVAKATMVSVPNAYNYGYYGHYLYHWMTGITCEYVGPRRWMRCAPIRAGLERGGMDIIAEGVIDVPWWPGFPELPDLVRRFLGRAPSHALESFRGTAEVNPQTVAQEDIPQLLRKTERSGFIERGRFWPKQIKRLFAHNVYVIGCKPQYRDELGL
jgi:hypothetical protein